MRPSNSVTFEPGVERGVPWGHDLFTFVTSAAGHMMRTLQRPRKNRPSKRQVNHRRFLHNMIQRKFAEIETANHQLASVLFSAEVANSDTPSPSRQPITTDLSNSTSKEAPVSEEADLSLCSHETEALATDQNDPGDQWRLNPKRLQMDQSNSNTPSKGTYQKTHKQGSRIENQTDYRSSITSEKTIVLEQEGEHFHTEPFSCDITSEESLYSWIDSIREKYETQLRRDSNSNITAPTQNQRALLKTWIPQLSTHYPSRPDSPLCP
ncbi:uncharacterized protein LOC121542891 [Coregonus clupeaformis]|uniref:uncharacterized protein LOC121542891 n=1 Tax=Coregonus clupeaformis TaxID=59861 RepID=UPI001E1C480E|nr:uncharacterized protein LOC121542891 [Coregonus clupeaformis]